MLQQLLLSRSNKGGVFFFINIKREERTLRMWNKPTDTAEAPWYMDCAYGVALLLELSGQIQKKFVNFNNYSYVFKGKEWYIYRMKMGTMHMIYAIRTVWVGVVLQSSSTWLRSALFEFLSWSGKSNVLPTYYSKDERKSYFFLFLHIEGLAVWLNLDV